MLSSKMQSGSIPKMELHKIQISPSPRQQSPPRQLGSPYRPSWQDNGPESAPNGVFVYNKRSPAQQKESYYFMDKRPNVITKNLDNDMEPDAIKIRSRDPKDQCQET